MTMKLIRNTTDDGTSKYALLRLDKMLEAGITVSYLKDVLDSPIGDLGTESTKISILDFIEFGEIKTEDEFFIIKLKDINSPERLISYARSALENGQKDLALDVFELATRVGNNSRVCKIPD